MAKKLLSLETPNYEEESSKQTTTQEVKSEPKTGSRGLDELQKYTDYLNNAKTPQKIVLKTQENAKKSEKTYYTLYIKKETVKRIKHIVKTKGYRSEASLIEELIGMVD